MGRMGWYLVALVLAGCGGFNTTVRKPETLQAYESQRAAIVAGQATRDEVRALLGEPWLESRRWGFELYRLSDQRRDVEWVMAPLIPVPMGAFKREVNTYTLVTWNDHGIISDLSFGTVVSGAQDEDMFVISSGHLTLAVDASLREPAMILWAEHSRLGSFLEARRESANCTLVVACDAGKNCPDVVVGVDDNPPLIGPPAFGPWYARGESTCTSNSASKLVYPLDLAPGNHRLQLRSIYPLCKGEADIEFTCAAGQVRFGRLGALERQQRRNCSMTLTADFADALPPDWAGRGITLWKNGQWLVEP